MRSKVEANDSPSSGIILSPNAHILIKVVRPEDGRVASEVVEVVHNNGYE